MAKLFFRKTGDPTTNRRQTDVVNGVAHAEFIDPDVNYSVSLRHTGLWADEGVRQNDDYLYLDPVPTDYNDRIQSTDVPASDGNVDLVWNKYPNYSAVSRWEKMKAVIAQNKAAGLKINYDTITPFGPVENTTSKWSGGLLLPNGKIFLVPAGKSKPAILDVDAGTVTPFGSLTVEIYRSASFMPDGRILCSPYGNTKWLVCDWEARTTSVSVFPDSVNLNTTTGSVLLPDGRILVIPFIDNQYFKLVDPSVGTWRNFGPANPGAGKYISAILLPNGKVIVPPYTGATQAVMVDPIAETVTPFGASSTVGTKYRGGVLIDDNTVIFVPFVEQQSLKVDISTLTTTKVGPVNTTLNRFYKGRLLADGRLIYANYNAARPYLFDPDTNNQIGITTTSDSATGKYSSVIPLPDGRVVMIPTYATRYQLITASDGNYGVQPDLDTLISSYGNNF